VNYDECDSMVPSAVSRWATALEVMSSMKRSKFEVGRAPNWLEQIDSRPSRIGYSAGREFRPRALAVQQTTNLRAVIVDHCPCEDSN
jgi:hypothetical protein